MTDCAARSRRLLPALAAALALLSTGACASLPVTGPVHHQSADRPGRQPEAVYFNPPGPAQDGSPAAIVSGFLVAMQANPLRMSVARSFLSQAAQNRWKPDRGTLVYEGFTVQPTRSGVRVRLTDTRRLDARGGWRGGADGSETLDVRLVSEKGQWRIDNPVDALVVPRSYFERNFARFNLYFFDQTGTVLLPDPVFIPRGEQTATNLVRGLLAGPGTTLAEVSRSAIPRRTALDLSVVVTESGIAEVPLSREVLQLPAADLARAVDQLAWTLRQVPGVDRVRLSVGGTPLPLGGGRTDVRVTRGADLDAGGVAEAKTLWGLRAGRIVDVDTATDSPVPGPLGRTGFSMRSLAVTDDGPRRVAAVSGDGTTVFQAPAGNQGARAPVTEVFDRGTDVLRPGYDMFGALWWLDRTERGARLYVRQGNRVRKVRVPQVTGEAVTAFSVARDGSRIAFALAGTPAPDLKVVNVLRAEDGTVTGFGSVRSVSAGAGDNGRVVDLGWRDPATLAVLTRTPGSASQVGYVSADGSPPRREQAEPATFRGKATSLLVAPDGETPLRLVTDDQHVDLLSTSGQWSRTASKVLAADYGQ